MRPPPDAAATEQAAWSRFVGELADHLAAQWPAMQERLGDRYPAFVELATQQALQRGLQGAVAVARYVNLWFVWGPAFHDKPGFEWAQGLLAAPREREWATVHQLVQRSLAELQDLPDALIAPAGLARGRPAADRSLRRPGPQRRAAPARAAAAAARGLRPGSRRAAAARACRRRALRATRRRLAAAAAAGGGAAAGRCGFAAAAAGRRAVESARHGAAGPAAAALAQPCGLRRQRPPGAALRRQPRTVALARPRDPRRQLAGRQPAAARAGRRPRHRDRRGNVARHLQARAADLRPARPGRRARQPGHAAVGVAGGAVVAGDRAQGRRRAAGVADPAAGPARQHALQRRVRRPARRRAAAAPGFRARPRRASADALQALLAAWTAVPGVTAPQLEGQLAVLAGRAAFTWGWKLGSGGLDGRALMRLLGQIEMAACQAELHFEAQLELAGARARLALHCVGSAPLKPDLRRESAESPLLATMQAARRSFSLPLAAELTPLAGDSGALLQLATPGSGALVGEAGLRPRTSGGSGFEWFVQLRLLPAALALTLHDPVLGVVAMAHPLWPAQTLLDWSL